MYKTLALTNAYPHRVFDTVHSTVHSTRYLGRRLHSAWTIVYRKSNKTMLRGVEMSEEDVFSGHMSNLRGRWLQMYTKRTLLFQDV
ncbi:hypothetical protein EG68_00552 [Paragonimus skrjabini miyazakii]|uniref:Uncharacterized protein n=1 Tax=Paragonimus skrjabini miyazakii TaxID=59628 RepID=A0A8S9Z9W8_9TREM|nr:hypothetical protein EG68_00552 [Paragonimus skrjabini miyazakii]